MDGRFEETPGISKMGAMRSCESMHRVISLLEAAVAQLHGHELLAQGTLLEAASLLRQCIQPSAAGEVSDGRGRLLAWQARKVRDHIENHLTGPLLVADLGALIQRSPAHFSRAFKRTFGESPHAYVVRRRLELAAHCMLKSDGSLSDIALRCGFADQAHLCKQFRQATGETPAAWRRAYQSNHDEDRTRSPDGAMHPDPGPFAELVRQVV